MHHVVSPSGVRVSFDRHGSGPPLVLVHGSFSDHRSNWEFVRDELAPQFEVLALARRGRGDTCATQGHSIDDEAEDVAAVLAQLPEPAFLLGHSYGAHVALCAARRMPSRVRMLVLYEPPWPQMMSRPVLARLETLALAGDWDRFSWVFFADALRVPQDELAAVRASPLWAPILDDARATLGDLRALHRHGFTADAFATLPMPVLLQTGSESPRDLYVTDALAAVLPDVRIDVLAGQAHEAMTTAPALYVQSLSRCLEPAAWRARAGTVVAA